MKYQTYLKPQNCVPNAHSGFTRSCVMKCLCMLIYPRCQIEKKQELYMYRGGSDRKVYEMAVLHLVPFNIIEIQN
jgi:hypothetical protein